MYNVRTDLAIERRDIYESENNKTITGVKVEEESSEDIKITTVHIENEEGERNMGKPIGQYITIEMPELTQYDGAIMDQVAHILAGSLEKIINLKEDSLTLVIGLGNIAVTPDALGPKVVKKLMITRHLKKLIPDEIDEEIRPVCALAPGVLGTTGIETGEIIKSLVDKLNPDLVICIDALSSRSLKRVAKTIQISNTGIAPGAGVGNNRMEINEKAIGVPVVAIGVPTVVNAATVANDAMDLVLDEMIEEATEGKEFYTMLKSMDRGKKGELIKSLLRPYMGELMVTPKDVDEIIDFISKIVANGINLALQPTMMIDEINSFLN
ncbi:GPR endopeptidase [Clostridium massiliamazoniense]|uniref:GPR endopeptidase n=1 Tax=Clostridium massiliamazoniense TaxID=1347366 RepID=UPI0006D861F3|nr:GPR endopeptidase [Clostridium massiliamazoniense]